MTKLIKTGDDVIQEINALFPAAGFRKFISCQSQGTSQQCQLRQKVYPSTRHRLLFSREEITVKQRHSFTIGIENFRNTDIRVVHRQIETFYKDEVQKSCARRQNRLWSARSRANRVNLRFINRIFFRAAPVLNKTGRSQGLGAEVRLSPYRQAPDVSQTRSGTSCAPRGDFTRIKSKAAVGVFAI
ncbi:hypothetical protein ACNKHO_09810 [Shigella flexneri]